GEINSPVGPIVCHEVQSSRSCDVDVSTKLIAVVPAIYSLVTETLPLPPKLHFLGIVWSTPLSGYLLSSCFKITAPASVNASTWDALSAPCSRLDDFKCKCL